VAQAQGLIAHYGARAVFAARFVPGLRTVAGPLAGAGGLPPFRFFAANLLGAICYVPWPVLAGYGVGYGLGDWVDRLRRAEGLREGAALFAAILAVAALAFIARTWARDRRAAWPAGRPASRSDERDI
jgi:membrane protein DedA with SNARE-associated domain